MNPLEKRPQRGPPEWYEQRPKRARYDDINLTGEKQDDFKPPPVFQDWDRIRTHRSSPNAFQRPQYQNYSSKNQFQRPQKARHQAQNINPQTYEKLRNRFEQDQMLTPQVETFPRDLTRLPHAMAKKIARKIDTGTSVIELTRWLLINMNKTLYELFAVKQVAIGPELVQAIDYIINHPKRFHDKAVLIFGNIFPDHLDDGHWILLCLTRDRSTLKVFDSYGDYHNIGKKSYEIPSEKLQEKIPNLRIEVNAHIYQNVNTGTCGYWYCALVYYNLDESLIFQAFGIPIEKNNATIRWGNDVAVTYFYFKKLSHKVKSINIPDHLLRGAWEESMEDIVEEKPPAPLRPEPMEIDRILKVKKTRKLKKSTPRQIKPATPMDF